MSNKSPHEIRISLTSIQRMKKTRERWFSFSARLKENFNEISEYKGCKIGDEISFVRVTGSSNNKTLSMHNGTLFAVGKSCFFVICNGKLEKVKIDFNK